MASRKIAHKSLNFHYFCTKKSFSTVRLQANTSQRFKTIRWNTFFFKKIPKNHLNFERSHWYSPLRRLPTLDAKKRLLFHEFFLKGLYYIVDIDIKVRLNKYTLEKHKKNYLINAL